jgi:hypothetical protein
VKLTARVIVPAAIVLAIAMAAPANLGAQHMFRPQRPPEFRAARQEVFVRLVGTSVEIHGLLTAFDATALTMEVDGRSYTFLIAEVLRVETIVGRNLIRGAVIGGLASAILCALVCGQGLDDKQSVVSVALENGIVGAVVGGLIGRNVAARQTVYKSPGSLAPISRQPSDLPCPATPLVLEADLSPIDVGQPLPREWTPIPQSHAFGASLCDGIAIRRHYDKQTGAWQPGIEIAAGAVDARSIDVRIRVTVRNPKGGRDKEARVDISLRQGGRTLVTAIFSIEADANEENSHDVVLRVPRALLSTSGLSIQVRLSTSY